MGSLRKQLSSSSLKSSNTTNIQYCKQRSLPPGAITEFVWKDYSSTLFRGLQELGNVRHDDYMQAVSRQETLMELALRGGCGRPVFLPHENRFIIKTLKKSEAKMLIKILPSYYAHIKKHEDCLLAKYYGLHATRPGIGGTKGAKIYFVVMENLLQTDLHLHKKYDLKGSALGRHPGKMGNDPRMTTLKDMDLDFCFFLHQPTRVQLLEQIKLDCNFLEEQGIMGYSLLLGVNLESMPQGTPMATTTNHERTSEVFANAKSVKRPPLDDSKQPQRVEVYHRRDPTLADFLSQATRPGLRFGAKIPARAIRIPRQNDMETMPLRTEDTLEGSSVYLYMGIIDFLQNYNVMKRIEHACKLLQYNAKDIPSVNPEFYATRFQDFFRQVFLVEGYFSPKAQEIIVLDTSFG